MQEILQKQGMIGGKQMRFRCRKTPINLLSIQVFGAGGAPQLQSKTVTPSASTQDVTPSSRYDGLSQVTVNGDSNLVSSNIKNGVNIFGVTGNYGSNILTLHQFTNVAATMSQENKTGTTRKAWVITTTLPQYDEDSNYIDYNSIAAVHFWGWFGKNGISGIAKNGYYAEFDLTSTFESIINSVAGFSQYPTITVNRSSDDSLLYHNMALAPTSHLNLSTRELKIGLTYNYGDGRLDNYLSTGSFTWNREIYLYTL